MPPEGRQAAELLGEASRDVNEGSLLVRVKARVGVRVGVRVRGRGRVGVRVRVRVGVRVSEGRGPPG